MASDLFQAAKLTWPVVVRFKWVFIILFGLVWVCTAVELMYLGATTPPEEVESVKQMVRMGAAVGLSFCCTTLIVVFGGLFAYLKRDEKPPVMSVIESNL